MFTCIIKITYINNEDGDQFSCSRSSFGNFSYLWIQEEDIYSLFRRFLALRGLFKASKFSMHILVTFFILWKFILRSKTRIMKSSILNSKSWKWYFVYVKGAVSKEFSAISVGWQCVFATSSFIIIVSLMWAALD